MKNILINIALFKTFENIKTLRIKTIGKLNEVSFTSARNLLIEVTLKMEQRYGIMINN